MRKSAQDRRAEIARATLVLAFEAGPQQVTTGMIADRLGLTQPAIYKHFPRKDDIWLAVADHLSTGIRENIAHASRNAGTPSERLFQLVLGHLKLVKENPALPEIMVMRAKKDQQGVLQSKMQHSMAAFRQAMANQILAARALGEFRDDIDVSDAVTLIFGVVQSLVLRLLVNRDLETFLADGERLLELQLATFATDTRA